jgi:hypothetical protein
MLRRSLIASLLLAAACGDDTSTSSSSSGTGGAASSTSSGIGGDAASTSSTGGGNTGGFGAGGAGGSVELVFASDWGTALGSSYEAILDGDTWDIAYCQSAPQTLTVVEGASLGWTKTPHVLRLQQLGPTICGTLEKEDAVPASTTHWGRFYFRNDETMSTHNHVVTYNPVGAIQVALWNRSGSSNGFRPFIRTYYDETGASTSYPTNLWNPSVQGVGPASLSNGTWYRYEWMMEYVTPTTYRIHPRIYDMSGRLLHDDATYFQNDYPQSGTASLASRYAAGDAFGFSDVSLATRFGLGNEGPATSPTSGEYWYHADVALSLEGWIGP